MKILKCENGHYTLSESCHVCGAKTRSPHPPKFSLEHEMKYGKFRRSETLNSSKLITKHEGNRNNCA